jgi:hypothetical protein
MKYFQEERITGDTGKFTEMIARAIEKGCIAIDDQGHAQQEYNDCCKPSSVGLNLCDWIADQIVSRNVLMFKMDRSAEKKLKELGVPRKDQKWPSIAKGADASAIVTEDIDLFDPKAKSYKASAKKEIRDNGGPVSKFLYKKHGISVLTCNNFLGEF